MLVRQVGVNVGGLGENELGKKPCET